MGFGFNLFFILVLVPLSLVLLAAGVITGRVVFAKALGGMWASVVGLVVVSLLVRPIFEKKVLEKKDFYGDYVIDREMFPGPNADWQYNTYRFQVRNDDSVFFHVRDGEHLIKTYKGTISTIAPYGSARLFIHTAYPRHHVIETPPTIYRDSWDFYLVFYSARYRNMYFKCRLPQSSADHSWV